MYQRRRWEIFQRHAKKFIDLEDAQEISHVIHYDDKGRGIVTDRKQLLIVNSVHSNSKAVTLHAGNAKTKFEYPNIDQLIPDTYEVEVTLFENVNIKMARDFLKTLIGYHKLAYSIAKDEGAPAKWNITNDKVELTVKKKHVFFSANYGVITNGKMEVLFNPLYVINVLSAIKDFQPQTVKIGVNQQRPIIFMTDVGVTGLVMPVRRPEK